VRSIVRKWKAVAGRQTYTNSLMEATSNAWPNTEAERSVARLMEVNIRGILTFRLPARELVSDSASGTMHPMRLVARLRGSSLLRRRTTIRVTESLRRPTADNPAICQLPPRLPPCSADKWAAYVNFAVEPAFGHVTWIKLADRRAPLCGYLYTIAGFMIS
jgi:hypothetical protein